MESTTLRAHLHHEYALLAAALATADPAAAVPSCPEWTAAVLREHVTSVYLHKVEAMRLGKFPDPWPPEQVGSLDAAYAALTHEFASRAPTDPTMTWFGPDQTVGFWIRRMAQETAIHRVDAEMAAGAPITPIADDLAVDGIDEVIGFLAFGYECWPDQFTDALASTDGRPVVIASGGRTWTLTATPERLAVGADAAPADASPTVTGAPSDVLRWLWNRGGAVSISDNALAATVSQLMAPVMQ